MITESLLYQTVRVQGAQTQVFNEFAGTAFISHQYCFALQDEAVRSYVKTDASLTRWQEGMSALYKQIVDTTPVGEISDSSMEFKFDGDSRRYMKSAILLSAFIPVYLQMVQCLHEVRHEVMINALIHDASCM